MEDRFFYLNTRRLFGNFTIPNYKKKELNAKKKKNNRKSKKK